MNNNFLARTNKKYMKFNLNKLIAFDTEDDSKGNITLASFYNGKKYKVFKKGNINKQIDKYIGGFKKQYFVGLNVMYDLLNIYKMRNVLEYFELFFGKSAFIFAKDKNGNVFFDLYWLMPFSLKEIGKILNLNKLETDNFNDLKYNKRDTEITYKAAELFLNFLNENRYDFSFTLASISMKIFKRYYIKHYKFTRYDMETIETMKKAYCGGRTENFVRGKIHENINVYDINSLYPYVMEKCNYPDVNTMKKSNKLHYYGIYKVDLIVKKDVEIPLIPVKSNKLIFPVGRFITWLTGAELLEAIKYKQIEDYTILQGFSFARGEKYFSRFVQDFYKKRVKNKNKFEKKVIKLLMNSLYGKFGQGRERTVFDGERFKIEIDDEFPENTIIPFAIFTTSFARIELFKYLNEANTRGKLFYCDTDSIHTNITFPTSEKLGALKLEGAFNYAEYFAPKMYLLDGDDGKTIHAKGVPPDFQEEFLNNLTVKYKKPNRLKESFRRNLIANKWELTKKDFKNLDAKRIFSGDKSLPLTLELK